MYEMSYQYHTSSIDLFAFSLHVCITAKERVDDAKCTSYEISYNLCNFLDSHIIHSSFGAITS